MGLSFPERFLMSHRWSIALAAWMAAIFNTSLATAADVGISVNVGQPGFYGRIDIGNFPAPPPVIYPQPVVVAPAPVAVVQRPIYLRVPPGHARNWSRHCARYNACGQQTYFVQDDWYQQVYVPARVHHHYHPAPRYHAARPDRRDHGHGHHGHRAHRHEGGKHRGGRGHDRD
jgi:hypothetical protein